MADTPSESLGQNIKGTVTDPGSETSYLWIISGFIPVVGLIVGIWLWFSKKLKKIAVLTLALAILSSGLYVFAYQKGNNNSTSNSSTANSVHRYQSLKPQSLSAGFPDTTIVYSKPNEFVVTDNNKTFLKNYRHKQGNPQQVVGDMAVSVAHVTGKLPTVLPPIVSKALASPSTSEAYQSETKPLITFTTQQLPKSLSNINLSGVKNFRSANIKDSAWQFDLNGTSATNGKWQGKFIYAWGKNGVYYVLIAATAPNWQANQSTWQQMVDSIKIDQP